MLEEFESLQAIYGEDCVKLVEGASRRLEVKPCIDSSWKLIAYLPADYPAEPPVFECDGVDLPAACRVKLEEIVQEYRGDVVVFQATEAIREALDTPAEIVEEQRADEWESEGFSVHTCWAPGSGDTAATCLACCVDTSVPSETPSSSRAACPLVVTGEGIVDRKSLFVGHAAIVGSRAEVEACRQHLLSDKRIARATHNIMAYRIRDSRGSLLQDNDDDGETAAGGRLAHMLDSMKLDNVFVMVSRWYGGVKLGPDRFKHINNAGRQAIDMLNA